MQGYLSSSSPLTQYLHPEVVEETKDENKPNVISLQSTSRPGCIVELDVLSNAKHVRKVQLGHQICF